MTPSPATHQTKEEERAGVTPTVVPSEFLALLQTKTYVEPAVDLAMGGTRSVTQPLTQLLGDVPPPPLPEPPPGEPDIPPPPVIGGRVEPAELIKQTMPVYPELARRGRVEGTVVLEGTVNVRGRVENIQVVSGHPMLIDAAIDAVRSWKYRPAKLNGQPVPCPVTVHVRFMLQYAGR